MRTEINILGAGPAGLSAAIILAKAGQTVHLHERYEVVGKRFQGDMQGLENWSTKEDVLELFQKYGLETTFPMTPFKKVEFTDGKRSPVGHSSMPLFYLVKRGVAADTLDTALCQQAERAGVNIHYRSTFPHEKADIIATGPIRQSTIAIDKGIVFETDHPDIAVGIFDDQYAHLGYSYLLVANGYGCICSVVFKDFQQLNSCFQNTLALVKKRYRIKITHERSVGGVGSFALNHQARLGTSLLAGEAAGLQDLLWGFGIRTAIQSGYLAAQTLLKKQEYPLLLQQEITPGLKASVVNRFLWEKFKWGRYPLLPYAIYAPISIRTLFRWLYRFSPIHHLLFPSAIDYIKKEYPSCLGGLYTFEG